MLRFSAVAALAALLGSGAALAEGPIAAAPPKGDAPAFQIKLFAAANRTGEFRRLTKSTPTLGSFNDRSSSVQAYGRWKLCTQPNFTGTCKVVNHTAKNLALIGIDNKIKSVRFVGGE